MKLKVQAQHLQPGDVVGSGEVVHDTQINGVLVPTSKIFVALDKNGKRRVTTWGKYTMINVERVEK